MTKDEVEDEDINPFCLLKSTVFQPLVKIQDVAEEETLTKLMLGMIVYLKLMSCLSKCISRMDSLRNEFNICNHAVFENTYSNQLS